MQHARLYGSPGDGQTIDVVGDGYVMKVALPVFADALYHWEADPGGQLIGWYDGLFHKGQKLKKAEEKTGESVSRAP